MKYKAIVNYGYGSAANSVVLGEYTNEETAINELVEYAKDHDVLTSGESKKLVGETLKNRGFYMCGWSSTELELEEVEA